MRQDLTSRSVPRQQRSRDKLALVLDAAESVLAKDGYDAFSTGAVAARAGVPPSAIYRWFADKDDLATALIRRHNARLDERVEAALAALPEVTLDIVIEAVSTVYVDYYREHRSHVILWFEGRVGADAVAEVHGHTHRVAGTMYAYGIEHGILPAAATELDGRVVAEALDRIHELAFRDDPAGDEVVLAKGVALVRAYYGSLS